MDNLDSSAFEELLTAVGEHLAAWGDSAAIVVVGGSALSMMGWVDRTTEDVDVIARAAGSARGSRRRLLPPVGLEPTDGELDVAAEWVSRQDPVEYFADQVAEEVDNVRSALGRD